MYAWLKGLCYTYIEPNDSNDDVIYMTNCIYSCSREEEYGYIDNTKSRENPSRGNHDCIREEILRNHSNHNCSNNDRRHGKKDIGSFVEKLKSRHGHGENDFESNRCDR